jgi:hypothetical protein
MGGRTGTGVAGFGNGGKGGGGSRSGGCSGGGGLGISGPLNFTVKEFEPADQHGRTTALGSCKIELHKSALSAI